MNTPTPQNPDEIERSLQSAKKNLARSQENIQYHTDMFVREVANEQEQAIYVADLEQRLIAARAAWSERSAVAES